MPNINTALASFTSSAMFSSVQMKGQKDYTGRGELPEATTGARGACNASWDHDIYALPTATLGSNHARNMAKMFPVISASSGCSNRGDAHLGSTISDMTLSRSL